MPPKPTLEHVYDEHVYDVHAFFAYSRLRKEDAEDLTQATFERALKAWHRFDPRRASPKTWLLTIARNLLIDHHRRSRGREALTLTEDVEPADGRPSVGDELRHDLSPALASALDSLSQREREVLALRFGGDMSGPEIAEMLGLSLANVQQIASRALRRLRLELEVGDEARSIA